MPPEPLRPASTSLLRTDALAWGVLGVTLVVTWFGWRAAHEAEVARAHTRFDANVRIAEDAIARRMSAYEQALWGGVALFDASADVTREEWHRYVTSSRLQANYPGIQGVGFSRWIRPGERGAIEAQLKREVDPEARVWTEPDAEEPQSAILFLEPLDARNRRAIGYDMWSEPIRRMSSSRARDQGVAAMSGGVRLKQEGDHEGQTGVLLYLPVYAPGRPVNTIDDRRAAFVGWVYAPFRMGDLMDAIFRTERLGVDVSIWEGPPGALQELYRSRPDDLPDKDRARFEATREMHVAGQVWTLTYRSSPRADTVGPTEPTDPLALASVGVNLLVFAFLLTLGRQHRAAQRLATELAELSASLERRVALRTVDLEESREQLQQTARIDALIAEVAERTSRETDLDRALQGCADALVERLDAALARIWLADEPPEGLILHASAGLSRRTNGSHARIALGAYKIGRIAKTRVPHLTNTVLGDPLVHDQAWAQREGLVAFAGYPLVVGEELLGVVAMFARHPLATEVMEGLGRVAQVLALGIARSRALTRLEAANERLQASLHEQARVAWLITHNLRTPLRAIHAKARALQDDRCTPEEVHLHAIAIAGDVKRFAAQVDDLVRFTTLYQEEIPTTTVDVRRCAELALADVRRASLHGERVTVSLGELPPCRGSSPLVQELLRNLLANAFSFTRTVEHPSVTVTGRTERGHDEDGPPPTAARWVHLEVHDNGIGFDMRFHDRIFELFQRLNRREDYPGTGCGLALARRIVERHEGTIWAESSPGAGATFHVRLPA